MDTGAYAYYPHAAYTHTHAPAHAHGHASTGPSNTGNSTSGGGVQAAATLRLAPSGSTPNLTSRPPAPVPLDRRPSRRVDTDTARSPSALFASRHLSANPWQPPPSPAMPPLAPAQARPAPPPATTGFRPVRDLSDLRPITGPALPDRPKGRRADPAGGFVSPLKALTSYLHHTYHLVNPDFYYVLEHNPRRVLTKPSVPVHNQNRDNENNDFILYVNDWLGSEDGDKYLILDMLGQGTFGQVVKCQNMRTHEIVAVKVIKNHPAYLQQSWTEVAVLELLNLQHDPRDEHHLLRLHDTFLHAKHLCLVFELLSSNLYELIRQNSYRGVSPWLVRVFTTQLLDSLLVLRNAQIIHCDMKPENILLKSLQPPLSIKLVDFGSACHDTQPVFSYIQSRFYRAPEVLLGLPYNAAIDMWSMGCIAAELFLGLPLFPGTSELNQITCIVDMLGLPPRYMLDTGKQARQFFNAYADEYGRMSYHLKTREQWGQEHPGQPNEPPTKKFFAATTLPDIIRSYPISRSSRHHHSQTSSSSHHHDPTKEQQQRACFIDFLFGLLRLDPLERWTPQQALLHPFITGTPFTSPFVPPPTAPIQGVGTSVAKRHVSQPPPMRSPQAAPQGASPQAPPSSTAGPGQMISAPLIPPAPVGAEVPGMHQHRASQHLAQGARLSYPSQQPPGQRHKTTGRDYAAEATSYIQGPATVSSSGTATRHHSLLPPPQGPPVGMSIPSQRARASLMVDTSGTLPPPLPGPSRRRSLAAPSRRARAEEPGLLPSPVFAPRQRYGADPATERSPSFAFDTIPSKEFSVVVDGQRRRDTPGAAPSTPGTPGRPGTSPRTGPPLTASNSLGSMRLSRASPGGAVPPLATHAPPVPPVPPLPQAASVAPVVPGAPFVPAHAYAPAQRGIALPPPLAVANRGPERAPVRGEVNRNLALGPVAPTSPATSVPRPPVPHVGHPPALAPPLHPSLGGGHGTSRARPGHPYSPSSRMEYSPRHWSGPPVGYTQR